MLNIALAIQNTVYQSRSNELRQTAHCNYMQHVNDIAHINDIIWLCDLMDGAIKIQFDRIKVLLKLYATYRTKLNHNYKIGPPCIWMPTNIAPRYTIDELSTEMHQLDASIRSEIYSCRKKIYKRYKRRNNRVRAHSC